MVLCTYCGSLSVSTNRCSNCNGHFDMLSRQRTQNAMGPWFIRDQVNPFRPGCSYDTLRRMVTRGKVRPDTIMRGPTTRQFWSFARNTPGVAHLLGACHACHAEVDPNAVACPDCNASFIIGNDRQNLGLAPYQMLPGDSDPAAVADAAFGPAQPPRESPPSAVHVSEQPAPEPAGIPSGQAVAPESIPARPVRKRSIGPMVAVAASVGCAAIALGALVYMNRSGSTSGIVAAAEPSRDIQSGASPEPGPPRPSKDETELPAREPEVTPEPIDPSPETSAIEASHTPDAASPAPEVEKEVRPPAPASEETERAGGVGLMTPEELSEARAEWARAGRNGLVGAVDRRLQHLELRRMFGKSTDTSAD